MRNLFMIAMTTAVIAFAPNSFGWSKYMAHRVVSEDISKELAVNGEEPFRIAPLQ